MRKAFFSRAWFVKKVTMQIDKLPRKAGGMKLTLIGEIRDNQEWR